MGLTQAELGALVDEVPSVICRLEQGTREPTFQTALQLSELFDVPIEKLFPDVTNRKHGELARSIKSILGRIKDNRRDKDARELVGKLHQVMARIPYDISNI